MKAAARKTKTEAPLDPVLFAATVPSRKPTQKDLKDVKEHEDDPIEPKEHEEMDGIVEDL
jgi:hypothetical protein